MVLLPSPSSQLVQRPCKLAYAHAALRPQSTSHAQTARCSLKCRAAAATEEATSREAYNAAVKALEKGLRSMDDLVPEHAVRSNPEFEQPIAALKKGHEQSDVQLASSLDTLNGWFDTGLNTTKFLTDEGYIELGTLTFQQFGPKDLKIQIQPGYWLEMGERKPDTYTVFIVFKISEGEHAGVKGISLPNGTYEIDEKRPYRQMVHFTQLKLLPYDTSPEGIQAWKAALQEANPDMAEDGTLKRDFPTPITGWRDYCYMDNNLHITVGNRNSVVITRRCQKDLSLEDIKKRLSYTAE